MPARCNGALAALVAALVAAVEVELEVEVRKAPVAWVAAPCRLWEGLPRKRGAAPLPTSVLTDVWHGNRRCPLAMCRQAGHFC